MVRIDLDEVEIADEDACSVDEGSLSNEDFDAGNQLPNVEEYKASVRPQSRLSRRKCRNRLMIAMCFIVAAIISVTVGVIYGRDTAPGVETVNTIGANDSGNTQNENNDVGDSDNYDASSSSSGAETTSPPSPKTPWEIRREKISNMAKDQGWSDASTVHEVTTAQYVAAQWMAVEDPQLLEIEDTLEFKQRYALVVFYYAMKGDLNRWYDGDLPWLNGDDVCSWNKEFP